MDYLIKPWQHQLDAIEKATKGNHFAFFAEMGCGKTVMAINTLRYICASNKRLLRTLILCPIVVVEQWKREFHKHSKIGDSVICLKGDGKKRTALFKETAWDCDNPRAKVFVTNYEALNIDDLFKLILFWKPEVVICDESQRIKNHKALRTKKVTWLSDIANYRYILSGSPILNTPMDIFSQFRVLDQGQSFGKNFFGFRAKYFYDKNAGMPKMKYFPNWQPLPSTLSDFNKIIYTKSIRVLKKDCLDLPPLVRKQVFADMSPKQASMYESMRKAFVAYLEGKTCVASMALVKGLRLQQITSGFFKTDEDEEIVYDDVPRLDALGELLEEITEHSKVIVWACFQKNYEMILDMIAKSKEIKGHTCTLTGGMSDKKRQESIDLFQENPDYKIMVANQGAGGIGVNLTAASYAIYYSRNFSLEQDIQSESRCHRGGSEIHEKITRIDIVTPNTIDEVILEALYRKENLANNILSLKGKL